MLLVILIIATNFFCDHAIFYRKSWSIASRYFTVLYKLSKINVTFLIQPIIGINHIVPITDGFLGLLCRDTWNTLLLINTYFSWSGTCFSIPRIKHSSRLWSEIRLNSKIKKILLYGCCVNFWLWCTAINRYLDKYKYI